MFTRDTLDTSFLFTSIKHHPQLDFINLTTTEEWLVFSLSINRKDLRDLNLKYGRVNQVRIKQLICIVKIIFDYFHIAQ